MPTLHPYTHLLIAAALVAAQAVLMAVVRNRVIRRRLLFGAIAALAAAAIHAAARAFPGGALDATGWPLEQLLLALAVGGTVVALLFNPWFGEGGRTRAPAIVQDAFILVAVVGTAAVVFHVSSFNVLTGSAIVAAIIGFALQETLGNAFAGIAIQIERPFRVGHWIAAGERVGRVMEVTWRATKILTKAGNMVIVPNSQMAASAIHNYSEPTAPTRLEVEVGADYGTPPNDVRDAILSAVRQARHVLASPPPDVLLVDFGASAILYRARFWIGDFINDDLAKDAARTAIYYEFRRRDIEIPWPIQVQYLRQDAPVDTPERRQRFKRAIAAVPVLAGLPEDAHSELAAEAEELLFADGEMVVREGDAGASMFLIDSGSVAIAVGPDRREVAVTRAGGYFGEMSLLTGEPRTATVIARGDCTVLEIRADAFRSYVQARPDVIDELAAAASRRRRELDDVRAAAGAPAAAAIVSLRDRMRSFFGLS